MSSPPGTWKIVREPKIISDWWVETKPKIVHELKHYWLGSKLLVAGLSFPSCAVGVLLTPDHPSVAAFFDIRFLQRLRFDAQTPRSRTAWFAV
jgi:hypothetical protein